MFCNRCGAANVDGSRFCAACGLAITSPSFGAAPADALNGAQTELGLTAGMILSNRYRVVKELGIGGMGRVYLAEDQKMEIQVAIKVLRNVLSQDPGSVKRLIAEAKHSIALSHPNVVRVHHFEDGETAKFLIMEYVEGETLAHWISREEKISERESRRIAIEICKGLEHAHQKKIIHRDIKPGNILLGKNGEIKLADFGIARECRDSMSRLTSQVDSGTLLYMSPEQLLGKSNEASDIYSLGIVLYEMLEGEPPFRSGDVPYQIREATPVPPVDISPAMSAIVMKCLEKKPENRYASAHELLEELDGTAEKRRIGARQRIEEEKKLREQKEARQREDAQRRKQEDAKARADKLVKEASALLESSRFEEAERRFQEALNLDPSHPEAKQGLNGCRIAQREAAQAQSQGQQLPSPAEVAPTPQTHTRNIIIGLIIVAIFFGGWFAINRISRETGSATTSDQSSEAQPPPADNSEQVRQLLSRARQAYDSGDYNGSIVAYDNVLAIDSFNQEAISGKAAAQKAKEAGQKKAKPAATVNRIDMEFVTIPAGNFMMGCSPGDSECYKDENPRHEVTIGRSFEMGRYEVTQGQWRQVMGSSPSYFKGDDRLPVENVSWNNVQGFIEKLNALNDEYRYRLPTEAEWEYAARAGTTGPYYGNLDLIGWYSANSGSKTHPVGQKQANGFGLYDMIGNVWEWCSDWYGEAYYGSSFSADPKGPSSGQYRTLRGGSWGNFARNSRVSLRNWLQADGRVNVFGVRLCRERL